MQRINEVTVIKVTYNIGGIQRRSDDDNLHVYLNPLILERL
jgi:hypothetical protein